MSDLKQLSDSTTLSNRYRAFIWTGGPDQVQDPVWFIDYLKAHKAHIINDPVRGLYVEGITGSCKAPCVIVCDGVYTGNATFGKVTFWDLIGFKVHFGDENFEALAKPETDT